MAAPSASHARALSASMLGCHKFAVNGGSINTISNGAAMSLCCSQPIASMCCNRPPLAPSNARFSASALTAAGSRSQNVALAAPRDKASSPSAPEPAYKSATTAPVKCPASQLNRVSRIRSPVGRRPSHRGKFNLRPRHCPPISRNGWRNESPAGRRRFCFTTCYSPPLVRSGRIASLSRSDKSSLPIMFFKRFKKSAPKDASTSEQVPPEEQTQAPAGDLEPTPEPEQPSPAPAAEQSNPAEPVKESLFGRIKRGLARTSSQFSDGLGNIFLGKKEIDDELLEDLESQLLVADVGIEATTDIIDDLTARVARKQLADPDALYDALKEALAELVAGAEQPLVIDSSKRPYVILVVGVNGVGKTTTIGKLTKKLQGEGKSVMLAAGDTFRAAAVEQLQVWGDRNNVPVIAQHTGADSASVIFDAIQSAKARGTDIVIADTAGRLQNKDNLMHELEKVVRVMKKLDDSAPHEVMLVLDAGTGQNALSQAQVFQQAVGVSGITLTKLDGTAKGGIVFAIARQLQLPIRFIGVGEQAEDLRSFDAETFVDALFDD